MKSFLLLIFFTLSLFANFIELHSFSANFKQTITDDQNKTLIYTGSLQAKEPQSALWLYKTPIQKSIYIKENRVVIIEPELEQVIVKFIPTNFDFFHMIQNAKKIKKDTYMAMLDNKAYTIVLDKGIVKELLYSDDFGNKIQILFSHQIQNKTIKNSLFNPIIPSDYDVIQG